MSYLSIPVSQPVRSDEDTTTYQYAVLDGGSGKHHVYGDQDWVASGEALREAHLSGKTQRRTVTITYGEWEDVP